MANNEERAAIKRSFCQLAGLPGVIRAVDGTNVPIKAPAENPEVYMNRMCFHAITLQATCTADLSFIDFILAIQYMYIRYKNIYAPFKIMFFHISKKMNILLMISLLLF